MMSPKLLFPRTAIRFASAALLTCGAALSLLPTRALAVTTPTGTLVNLHSFVATEASALHNAPIRFTDGNFYGASYETNTIYKVAADGTVSTLHTFINDFLKDPTTLEGDSPKEIIQGTDGNLYGICRGGGTAFNTPDGGGTIYQIALPSGTYTKLYDFENSDTSIDLFPSALVQGGDGNLYGLTRDGGDMSGGGGAFFRFNIASKTYTQLFQLKSGDGPGYRPEAQLIVGKVGAHAGKFYGVTTQSGNEGGIDLAAGTIFEATEAGTVTKLHAFIGGSQTPGGSFYALTEDAAGNFYGLDFQGAVHGYGAIYRLNTDGAFIVLHEFDDYRTDGGNPTGPVTIGSDGNIYGSTTAGFPVDPTSTVDNGTGSYYQLTPDTGIFTTLYKTQFLDQGEPRIPIGALTEVSPSLFLGVTVGGGTTNDGTIVALAVSGGTAARHPFFDGSAYLGNGFYYLGFESGVQFGYYYFFTEDKHYLYSPDLGYEYVFDVTDANDGVYTYDFLSKSFFYTSPADYPYIYDFNLGTFLYYFPEDMPLDPINLYTNHPRYFYNFATGEIITIDLNGT